MTNSKAMHRVFVGLLLDQDLVERLMKSKDVFSNNWSFRNPKNIHITIIPHWLVDNLEDLILKCQSMSLDLPKFQICFDIAEVVWDLDGDQIIWSIGSTPPQLDFFRKSLAEKLEHEIFEDYLLHSSLARNRSEQVLEFERIRLKDCYQIVNKLCLYETIDSPNRSNYVERYAWELY